MKPGPAADYPVKVFHEPSEMEPPEADLYDGVFTAVLNVTVRIVFVPDVGTAAPPWDGRLLPAELDDVATPEQARIASAVFGRFRYVVTPNGALAGADERFEWVRDGERRGGVVFYVAPDEFARYAADLGRLAELSAYSLHPKETVSMLRDYGVIGFIERRVLASRWLRADDAAMLCLAPAGIDGVVR